MRECHKWWPYVQFDSQHFSVTWIYRVWQLSLKLKQWPSNGALPQSQKASTPSWVYGSKPVVQVSAWLGFKETLKAGRFHLHVSSAETEAGKLYKPSQLLSQLSGYIFVNPHLMLWCQSVTCDEHTRRKVNNTLCFFNVHGLHGLKGWVTISYVTVRVDSMWRKWADVDSDSNG